MSQKSKGSGTFIDDVIFLGIRNISDTYGMYAAIMPFINEIANVFTLTIFKPAFGLNLYPRTPHGLKQIVVKAFIDMLAITGIAANASEYGSSYMRNHGLVIGSIYALFTFFIPLIFIQGLLNVYESRTMKFIIGMAFIYCLDVFVHGLSFYYIKQGEGQLGNQILPKAKKEDDENSKALKEKQDIIY